MVSPDGTHGPLPPDAPAGAASGGHRYGLVLGLTILAVLCSILAPDTPAGRAVAVSLQGTMLLAMILTSRPRERGAGGWSPTARTLAAAATVAALVALAVLVGATTVPRWVGSAVTLAAVLAVLVVLVRGIVRLVRRRGVTVQAVAGALTIYLLVGLGFALLVRVIVGVSPHPYFAQLANGAATQSQEVYFSFTTLTTTGYGDLTPVLGVGRALSVLEMLVGQIYLVTVIGLLVGNLRRGAERTAER